MSFWVSKTINKSNLDNYKYVLLKHRIRGFNGNVCGVKFRDGYCAIIENSKVHYMLRRTSALTKEEPMPLLFLKELKFINRLDDVKTIYGAEVFFHFMREYEAFRQGKLEKEAKKETENKLQEEKEHLENLGCHYRLNTGLLCSREAEKYSPSKYCTYHLLLDPKLDELGIKFPSFIARDEKKKVKNSVIRQLKEINRKMQ